MTQPLVSVIVPVYKVEPYLRQCVDSILNQTYRNLEIILVDDGSPDNCGVICDEYAAKDSRIKVIHKPNGGLSDARNAGMKIMSGEWLMFVDSDDILERKAVSDLLCKAEKNHAHLVIGGNRRFENDDELIQRDNSATGYTADIVLDSLAAMKDFFQTGCAAWARLYKKEIHEDVFFPVGEINEDEAVVLRILERCENVVKTAEVVYGYRCRPESITTNSFHEKKMIFYRHCCDNEAWIRENHPEITKYAMARRRGSILTLAWMIALSDRKYTPLTEPLVKDLRERSGEYRAIAIGKRDLFFCFLLTHFPFGFYRFILRLGLRLKGHHLEQV